MERASRLRRYLRKDYTQLVEFPVEIVGRDGMVRRYSFDDSVRLYHRRIHSASMRYDDGDLVDAEVRHCRQRIDQLRRSYLEHYGWASLREAPLGRVLGGPLAAEVAAFLRRAFSAEREGPSALRLTLVDSGPGDTFYLRCGETGRAWILYAWRLDTDGPEGARAAWQETMARLSASPPGDGVERLLLAMEGPDLVLALAGSGEWAGPTGIDPGAVVDAEGADPLHVGIRALYDGQGLEALILLEHALDRSPGRLALAQAASLVALLEGEAERAEFSARFGLAGRPRDVFLHYLLGVSLCRLGRRAEALGAIEAARRSSPQAPLLALLAGALALRGGRVVRAWRLLSLPRQDDREARYAARTAGTLRSWIARGALLVASSILLATAGVALLTQGATAIGIGSVLGATVVLLAAGVVGGRRVRALLGPERVAGVPRMVSLELLPRESGPSGHN